ncbi:MAG: hypothetical protein HY425_02765 [Candidatus Levybacteria bacterium]|nr:hypothetical protein [Candidatus Levybacteria bacterium]
MMFKKFIQIWRKIKKKKDLLFDIPKRQKFIISVAVLSLILFSSEQLFGKRGAYAAILLSVLTDIFIFWAVKKDIKDNFSPQIFILPFFYSLACALFYFLFPARLAIRIGMTLVYAIGLYSLLLSENIFIVSSIRTIALLSSARTVSFVITILTYLFLSNVIFSLHANVFLTLFLIIALSFPLILHSFWTHTLDGKLISNLLWIFLLTVCSAELALAVWFWPAVPMLIGIFLAGFFYVFIGLSQVWLDRRLFKNVVWGYVWVSFFVLLLFATLSLKAP